MITNNANFRLTSLQNSLNVIIAINFLLSIRSISHHTANNQRSGVPPVQINIMNKNTDHVGRNPGGQKCRAPVQNLSLLTPQVFLRFIQIILLETSPQLICLGSKSFIIHLNSQKMKENDVIKMNCPPASILEISHQVNQLSSQVSLTSITTSFQRS